MLSFLTIMKKWLRLRKFPGCAKRSVSHPCVMRHQFSNVNSACLFSIILEEAQNKKLIQRSETRRDFADVDGDTNSQYRSWETDYVERKEKTVCRRDPRR